MTGIRDVRRSQGFTKLYSRADNRFPPTISSSVRDQLLLSNLEWLLSASSFPPVWHLAHSPVSFSASTIPTGKVDGMPCGRLLSRRHVHSLRRGKMVARAGAEYLVDLAAKQMIDDATKNAKEKISW